MAYAFAVIMLFEMIFVRDVYAAGSVSITANTQELDYQRRLRSALRQKIRPAQLKSLKLLLSMMLLF